MHDTLSPDFVEENDYWVSALPPDAGPVRVTIVIPVFKAATTLPRAVRSALGQSLRDIEVIIVDDASPDESWDMILSWLPRDARLRAVRNKINGGKSVGMNRAIALARGTWIAVLDADDWYHHDRLAGLMAVADRWQADMVADNQFFYDSGVDTVVGPAWPASMSDWPLNFDDFLAGANAYDTFNLGMLKPVMRTDFLRRTGLDYEERAKNGQDFFYLLQFYLLGGKAAVSDRAMYFYTQPFGTLSRRWSHAARMQYDFHTSYDINRAHLTTAARTATPAQIARLKRRTGQFRVLKNYYSAKDALDQKRIVTALFLLLRHPEAFDYAFRRLLGRYFKSWSTFAATRIAARCRRRTKDDDAHILGVFYENRSPRYR